MPAELILKGGDGALGQGNGACDRSKKHQQEEQHAHNVPEGHAFKHLRNRDEHQRGACLQGVRVAAGEGKHRRDNHQTGHNRNRGVKNFDVLGGFLNRDILFHIRAEGDQNAHRDGQ